MALSFADASNDLVTIAAGASFQNLDPQTIIFWIKFDDITLTSFRRIAAKSSGASQRIEIFWQGPGSDFRCTYHRSTTIQTVEIDAANLTSGAWAFCAFQVGASITPVAYKGSLTSAAINVSQDVNAGAGTHDDSGAPWQLGDYNDSDTNQVCGMDIGLFMVVNAQLSLAQLHQIQLATANILNRKIHLELGFLPPSTGTQIDLSGNGNNATVTSGTTKADHPPKAIPLFHLPQYKLEPAAAAAGAAARRHLVMIS